MLSMLRLRPLPAHARWTAHLHEHQASLRQGRCRAFSSDRALAKAKGLQATLQLPETPFDIRANAEKREILFRQRTCTDLYRWQAEQTDRPTFTLHDGPPYANGPLHMGHALNKMAKDFVNRYQLLRGNRIDYRPGWDCHGLPIESKAVGAPQFKGMKHKQIPPTMLREAAKQEATKAIEIQRVGFQKFGIMADWSEETTYRSFDRDYELRQLRIFSEMARRGLIYRARRPVYWSPSSGTALAEAELEYNENHFSSSVYVRFELEVGPKLDQLLKSSKVRVPRNGIGAIIWTTTPWSLPSNMALTVNPVLDYSVVRCTEGALKDELLILARDRISATQRLKVGKVGPGASERSLVGPLEELLSFSGSDLLDSKYRHSFLPAHAKSRPILGASYVEADAGTGLVHCAPGHGIEDYQAWQAHRASNAEYAQEEILSPIDDEGKFTAAIGKIAGTSAEELSGKTVLGSGTKEIVILLEEAGVLLCEQPLQHRYPYDWRSKLPVLVRTTPQWFANLEPIKDAAIAALKQVTFVPATGKTRMASMIRRRNEWCISRQRAWGVPIPVVYNAENDEALLTPANIDHIIATLKEKGTDYWWEGTADEFVAQEHKHEAREWRKGTDTVDVWFDSGSSWSLLCGEKPANKPVANVYLEGTDQHRGWFQSSLLTYVATQDSSEGATVCAPYGTVLTHGFVVDKRGQKMSKSIGNVISPLHFVEGGPKKKSDPAYGTDVLRLWAARGDYTADIPVGTLIVKHASEALRKLRNTARFMLANLPTPSESDASGKAFPLPKQREEMTLLDRYILHQLYTLDQTCQSAYDSFDFPQVVRRLSEFASSTLSTLYFDVAKDSLYADSPDSKTRSHALAVLSQILDTFSSILAPITPHLVEEIDHFRRGATKDPSPDDEAEHYSFFKGGWRGVDEMWKDENAQAEMNKLLSVRDKILSLIESARQAKWVHFCLAFV